MPRRSKILVQTTVPKLSDDWSVDSLTLLREHLDGLEEEGNRFEAVGRNREVPAGSSDPHSGRL